MAIKYFKNKEELTIAIIGSGGEGVISAGEIFLRAGSQNGLYGMMLKSYGPQIRGGETMAQIRMKNSPVLSQGDLIDALIVLNWDHYYRFAEEISLDDRTVIFYDNIEMLPPDLSFPQKIQFLGVPFTEIAKKTSGTSKSKNLVALGFLSGWFGLAKKGFEREIQRQFAGKNKEIIYGNLKSFKKGVELAESNKAATPLDWSSKNHDPKMILTGNEAISLGSLFAGVQFYAGYPITPASEIMEWMANELPKYEDIFIQTEDEITAITMAIGASFAGAKSMTATSGPGLSLMTEAIGLAAMAELPVVIVDVQRAGPSTGIPTKTTQADLFHAVFGGHGDFPRVVLAPVNVTDAITIAVHAFYLAEKYQLPVLILSDQFLGQRLEIIPTVDFKALQSKVISRSLPLNEELHNYKRYKMTSSGVSPISKPGIKNGMYTAYGTEHDELSIPTSSFNIHERMSRKRLKKNQTILQQESDLLLRIGNINPRIGILAWGSTTGAVQEAVSSLLKDGYNIGAIAPRQLKPLPINQLQTWVKRLENLLIFELSEGQFYTYLKSEIILPRKTRLYARPGVNPFTVHEIIDAIMESKSK